MKVLLVHQWLQFKRSGSFERELGLRIVVGIIAIIFIWMVFQLSSNLPQIFGALSKDAGQYPIKFFCQLLIYYYTSELFSRYLIQNIPVLDLQPYLTLPISRSKLSLILIVKSILNPINIIPLVLIIPFSWNEILPAYGAASTILWVMGLLSISFSLNFFILLFKNKLEQNFWVWVVLLGLFLANYLISSFLDYNFIQYLGSIILYILQEPYLALIFCSILILLITLTYQQFKSQLYLEDHISNKLSAIESYSANLNFLSRAGIAQQLILEEARMILRHKRTRSTILGSLLFIVYIFLTASNLVDAGLGGTYIFIGIFSTGAFAINYGQFAWSWHTNQMDFLFTRPISLEVWVNSKYQLMSLITIIIMIITLPILYFGRELYVALLVCGLYNLGINIPLVVRLALWDPKAIDLNKGTFMNYQGVGAAQWLMALPLLLGPVAIFYAFDWFLGARAGLIAVGSVGILGLLLRDLMVRKTADKLKSLKYKLINNLSL